MVSGENPIADLKRIDARAQFYDFGGNLMAQNQRRFLDAIPLHQVAAANPARPRTQKQLAGTDLRNR